jgi:hypothetical protein
MPKRVMGPWGKAEERSKVMCMSEDTDRCKEKCRQVQCHF